VNVAVIELDLDAPPRHPSSPPPARLIRPLGLALAALLALCAGGAATVESRLWRSVGVLPLADAESVYTMDGDRIYTAVDEPGGRRVITARYAGSPAADWTVTTANEEPDGDNVVPSGVRLRTVGDGLLLTGPTYTTTMFDADSGAVRWTQPAPVQPVAGGVGVSERTAFRPGTEYDQSSGNPGMLYFSADGRPHTEPPRNSTAVGIDLRTGEQLWTDRRPGAISAVPVAGDAVLVAGAGRLTVRAARSGQVLRETALAAGDHMSWLEAAGDVVLVRRGQITSDGALIAYRTDTLRRVWEVPDPMPDGQAGSCFDLACRRDAGGLAVLDPVTGRPRWQALPGVSLTAWGGGVLETETFGGNPIRLLDPVTGAPRVPLRGWERVSGTTDRLLLLSRIADGGRSRTFAVLRPGDDAVRLLGTGPTEARDCDATDRYVACRVREDIQLWSYRA
jgi:hypothetical protein